jgi:hypothetical protein
MGTIVGAGTDVLYVPGFPQPVAIMLAVRLAAAPEEILEGQAHELVVRVEAPGGGAVFTADGSEAPPLTATFQAADPTAQPLVPGWLMSPLFALVVQWLAPEQGTYTLVVSAGDSDPSRSPVHVLPALA